MVPFFFVGTYSCSGAKWKGEFTNQEHTPAPVTRPMARKGTVTIGFSGTYTDTDAQFELTALVGKRSLQYQAIMRLLARIDQSTAAAVVTAGTAPNECIREKGED